MALAYHDGWGEEETRLAKLSARLVNAILHLGKKDRVDAEDYLVDWLAEPEAKPQGLDRRGLNGMAGE